MLTTSSSLTEKVIIDPILTLRAPLQPNQTVSWTATVWQGIQSEVIARVVAVFTSVVAAIDALIHFVTGVYKGACLLARTSDSESIVFAHFRQAAWFTGLAVVGSIAGVVWPDIFKHQGSIHLLEEQADKEIRMPVGKSFSIELSHSFTTGHFPWEISQLPSFINQSEQHVYHRTYPRGICGGGNDHVFVFETKEPGRGNIVMQLPDLNRAGHRTVERIFTIIAE